MLLGLRYGDPHEEVLGAWLAKESVRDVYLTDDPAVAAVLLDKAIVACAADPVAEINTLGNTLASWRTEGPSSRGQVIKTTAWRTNHESHRSASGDRPTLRHVDMLRRP